MTLTELITKLNALQSVLRDDPYVGIEVGKESGVTTRAEIVGVEVVMEGESGNVVENRLSNCYLLISNRTPYPTSKATADSSLNVE